MMIGSIPAYHRYSQTVAQFNTLPSFKETDGHHARTAGFRLILIHSARNVSLLLTKHQSCRFLTDAMNITAFRTANLDDVDALVQLVNNAYHPEPGIGAWTDESRFVNGTRTNQQALKKLLAKDGSVVLLGMREDTILACVHVEKSASHAHIGMLAVNPAWQGAGIGKQMLAQAEAYARHHFDIEKFVLLVISLRRELLAFYLRRGYLETGTTIDYALLCGPTCDAKIAGLRFVVLEKPVY